MATLYVPVTLGSIHADRLMSAVNTLRNAECKLSSVKQVMDAMIDGADYSELETYFGLPTGEGSSVWTNVSNALTEIQNDATVQQLMDMLGAY
jgi:hypothetical protein